MKSKLLICLIILCVLFSLTAVSASENQSEVISCSPDYHPFSELNQLISESDGEISLEHDYQCDGNRIEINKDKDFIINGNNHTINGLDDTPFVFHSKGNILVNNLTFQISINATIDVMSEVIFNNVKFINCTTQKSVDFIQCYSLTKFDGCLFKDITGYNSLIFNYEDVELNNSICSDCDFIKGCIVFDIKYL